MANRIKMAKVSAIIELHRQGWSNRAIAAELDVHRDTVARCLKSANSKPAKAPPPGRRRLEVIASPIVIAS